MAVMAFLPFSVFILASLSLCINLHPITAAATLSNETDRLSLLAFKDSISNDSLKALSSWNDSLHFCRWRGVTCSRRHRRVTVLSLSKMGLKGYLSPHIANLTFLRRINLRENKFHGALPPEIGHLFRLRHLLLSRNTFQGRIPTNISRCSELRTMNLGRNGFSGVIPAELGSLHKLTVLSLQSNKLVRSIPLSIGNASSLTRLSLADNSLHGDIPVALSRLTNLEFLELSGNRLSGSVPSVLYNLSSIYSFSVTDNSLSGQLPPNIGLTLPNIRALLLAGNHLAGPIPTSLGNASRLKDLDLASNQFSGVVPMILGNLPHLTWLNLADNRFGTTERDDLGFLAALTNCDNLMFLGLEYNKLKGQLPDSIANLSTQLTILTMSKNQIFGRIPPGIGNLVGLIQLALDENFITGNIPFSTGKLHNLQSLDFSINGISGSIPSSIGNLSSLRELYIEENNLEGAIPPSLENCRGMYAMNLSQNNLNGTIPKQIFSLVSLTFSLSLDGNSLTGNLGAEIGNLINIEEIYLSRNRLSGEIPPTLGSCLKLEFLGLRDNFFSGTIPQSLNELKVIELLDLSHNNLSGKIPKYLGKLPYLSMLNLSFNDLEGEVPQEGALKDPNKSLVLGNRKLCGGIPALKLPLCPVTTSRTQGQSSQIKVIIPISGAVLGLVILLCALGICYCRRKTRNRCSTPVLNDQYLKVSYAELLQATDSFSSSNLIGFGSYGAVYKGHLGSNGTIIAVKVVNLQQRGASKNFIAECEALKSIRHRNLVKVVTACSSVDFKGNDFKALVLEFMPNGSLDKWLHPQIDSQHELRKLTLIEKLNIAIDIASALEYLHHGCETPVIHCDLKPSNVLLDGDMTAHVGDFGLARFLTSDDSIQHYNSSSLIKGSIGYLAPEYGMGGKASADGDAYSYGILLLEMFTGKRPTDDMFNDNLSLHKLAKMAFPEKVMEIVDPMLLLEDQDEYSSNVENARADRVRMELCLVSVIRIALECSNSSPGQRMDMRNVVMEMHGIRDKYLGVGPHRQRTERTHLLVEGTSYFSNY